MRRDPGLWALVLVVVLAIVMALAGCQVNAAKVNALGPAMAQAWPGIRADADVGIDAMANATAAEVLGIQHISAVTANLKRERLVQMDRAVSEFVTASGDPVTAALLASAMVEQPDDVAAAVFGPDTATASALVALLHGPPGDCDEPCKCECDNGAYTQEDLLVPSYMIGSDCGTEWRTCFLGGGGLGACLADAYEEYTAALEDCEDGEPVTCGNTSCQPYEAQCLEDANTALEAALKACWDNFYCCLVAH